MSADVQWASGIATKAIPALTLAGTASPTIMLSTSWVDHPAYSYSGFLFSGYSWQHDNRPMRRGTVDTVVARELYSSFDAVNENDRAAIFLATDRLRRSRGQWSPVERAIDLGIALETSLMHDIEHDHRELRFRLALRAAWFIAESPTEREAVFRAARKTYDLRSTAVHSGVISPSKKTDEELAAGDEVCSRVLRKLVSQGGFPVDRQKIVLSVPENEMH
jgi:hypothetical protein